MSANLSKAAQQMRLLDALQTRAGVTTSDAREQLAVMHPAGRVRELRAKGFDIETHMLWASDDAGVLHRQALYVLHRGDDHA